MGDAGDEDLIARRSVPDSPIADAQAAPGRAAGDGRDVEVGLVVAEALQSGVEPVEFGSRAEAAQVAGRSGGEEDAAHPPASAPATDLVDAG